MVPDPGLYMVGWAAQEPGSAPAGKRMDPQRADCPLRGRIGPHAIAAAHDVQTGCRHARSSVDRRPLAAGGIHHDGAAISRRGRAVIREERVRGGRVEHVNAVRRNRTVESSGRPSLDDRGGSPTDKLDQTRFDVLCTVTVRAGTVTDGSVTPATVVGKLSVTVSTAVPPNPLSRA